MDKVKVVKQLLANTSTTPKAQGQAYAPSNIALIKYWGKRDQQLNLPLTSSLSISLGDQGCHTTITPNDTQQDQLLINQQACTTDSEEFKRCFAFVNLLLPDRQQGLVINSEMNIPLAAGLASSACGFAALTLALNDLYQWQLNPQHLSILARLGSGSACRSIYQGFVEWHQGDRPDGLDSFATPLNIDWPDFRLGLLVLNSKRKTQSSRQAMQQTIDHSQLFTAWPQQVANDLAAIKTALQQQDFHTAGQIAENNALSMHATMIATKPAICYWQPETLTTMHTIWQARNQGLPLYFTMDAGPNVKLLFLQEHEKQVKDLFGSMILAM